MNKQLKVLFAIFASLLLPVVGFAKHHEDKEDSIVVGMTSAYAPFVSLNEKGEYEGFDIDVANLVGQKLNKKVVLKDLGGMTGLLIGLQKEKIDAIFWAMSITEKRQKEMEMVYYQGEKVTTMPFIFWKSSPQDLSSIEDFAKKKFVVCVEAGSYQDSALQKYKDLQIRYMDKISDSIMEIKYGKAQTAAIDNSLVSRIKEQYPEIQVAYLPLDPDQQTLGNGICIRKENQELKKQVEQAIHELIQDGTIAKLEKKWNLDG